MLLSRQFNLAGLLAWIGVSAIFMVSAYWAVTSTILGKPEDVPLVYGIGFPLMGFGLIIAPFLCVACLLAIIVISLVQRQIAISSLMFLGYAGLAILALECWWQSGFRIIVLMTICAAASILETLLRELPPWHWWVAGLTVATTGGYYFLLAASVACAAA